MLQILKDTPEAKKFAPRVDNATLVIEAVSGEAGRATLNKTGLTVDEGIAYWDAGNTRLVSSSVKYSTLDRLSITTPGTAEANKVLVVDGSKNLAGVNSLEVGSLTAVTASITTTAATTVNAGTVNVSSLSVSTVTSNLVFNQSKYLGVKKGTSIRPYIQRPGNVDTVYVGNSNDSTIITSKTALQTNRSVGGAAGIVWSGIDQGAGTGMDADLLDAQHGSYYRNADNINAGTLNAARLPYALTAGSTSVSSNFTGSITVQKNNYGIVELVVAVEFAFTGSASLLTLGAIPTSYAPSTIREFVIVKYDAAVRTSMHLTVYTTGTLEVREMDSASGYAAGDDVKASLTWLMA